MAKKGWKYVTDKELTLAHALKDAGLSVRKAQEVLHRGYMTVQWMYQADNLEDYKAIVRQYNATHRPKPVELPVEAPSIRDFVEANQQPSQEWQKMFMSQTNAIIALLKAIEYKLDLAK